MPEENIDKKLMALAEYVDAVDLYNTQLTSKLRIKYGCTVERDTSMCANLTEIDTLLDDAVKSVDTARNKLVKLGVLKVHPWEEEKLEM